MTVDREELKKRYAAMSDAELGLINREELGYLARECYDGEVCRRDVERPATVPFVGVAGGSAVEPPSRGTRYLLLGVIWAFVLLVGAEYFAFEHVANWLGILCWWIGGGILSFKLARDQERNAGFWLVLTLFLGPIAALVLLALSPELGRVLRVLVVVVPFIVSAIVVQGLCALTGLGAYRVVKAADVAIGGGAQENLCDQVVNVEGEITEVGSQVLIFLDVDPGQQARAFALVDESSKLPNGSSLAVDVIGNKRYPLPRIGERLRVGGLVRCVTSIGPGKFGTLLEVSRRPLQ